jgi:hypothetical protein
MKVIQPITITPAMVVQSSLFETAPATYAAGTTYALGDYVGVAGNLGEILIYKSLQASNTGNTPSTSPTWWVYSSSTYAVFTRSSSVLNQLAYRVLDTSTHSVYESVTTYSKNQPLNVALTPVWLPVNTPAPALPATWNAGTTYATGTLVYFEQSAIVTTPYVYIRGVYKSNASGNTGNPPEITSFWDIVPDYPVPYIAEMNFPIGRIVKDTNGNTFQALLNNNAYCPLNNTPLWIKVAPSNNVAMFDDQTQTKSVANKEITLVIASGIIDTIGLIGVSADKVVITVRDGIAGAVVFTKTVGLTGGNPTNAWDYYFTEPTLRTTQAIIDGIPPYLNSYVTIALTGSGTISIGNLILGKGKDIGLVEYGASAGILDFSTKTTDIFGVTTFTKRGFKKTVSVRAFVDNAKLNVIQNNLYAIRATPCLWVGSTDPRLSESLVIYGFYKDFRTEIPYPDNSYISIEIEGLI